MRRKIVIVSGIALSAASIFIISIRGAIADWISLMEPNKEALRSAFLLGIEYGGVVASVSFTAVACFVDAWKHNEKPKE